LVAELITLSHCCTCKICCCCWCTLGFKMQLRIILTISKC